MTRMLLAGIAALFATHAAAQESAQPVRSCVTFPASRVNPVILNKCPHAIYLELFDVERRVIVEGEVKPNETIAAPAEAFGAACPAGFRSSVPLMLVNRQIFAKDMYACIRK